MSTLTVLYVYVHVLGLRYAMRTCYVYVTSRLRVTSTLVYVYVLRSMATRIQVFCARVTYVCMCLLCR